MARRGSLVIWSWVVLALVAAHDVTHVLDDGLDTPLGLFVLVALPQWIFLAAVMAVVLRGDPARSRIAAMLLGASIAIGFTAFHLLPFSLAAYEDLSPSAVSSVLVWAPPAAGLVLVVLAWRAQAADRVALGHA